MKSSLFIIAAGALLASASPVAQRRVATEVVFEMVTVTVTEDQRLPTSKPNPPANVVTKTKTMQPPAKKKQPAPQPPANNPPPANNNPPPAQLAQGPPPQQGNGNSGGQGSSQMQPSGDYQQTMLRQHNVHRSNHSANALTWDANLANYADTTARTCNFAHDTQTGGGGYGQNLASWSSTTDINSLQIRSGAQAVTNFWYNSEMGLWNNNYGKEPSGSLMSSAGHFSQIVWKGTQQVGCATVYCPSGRGTFSMNTWYTVCNYRPAGNFIGRFGQNVGEPAGNRMVTV